MNTKARRILTISLYTIIGLITIAGILCWVGYRYISKTYEGSEAVRIYIPSDASPQAIADSLRSGLGEDFGNRVYKLWTFQKADPKIAHGSYVIHPGDKAITISRNLRFCRQSPVKVTFNNIRTYDQLAQRIVSQMDFSKQDFKTACDDILPELGFKDTCQFPAAFMPDTYEFYWTAPASDVVSQLASNRNRFWNDDRRAKAKQLGLTPVQVATIASIVEEETNKADERPLVARLYLNRISCGMKLQADPTVKFAIGDFTLRRIGGSMLQTDSPYNTYLYKGLPPGPIRIPDPTTIDAVLDAPGYDYLYMCASLDRPGYHDFAQDYNTHKVNARRYQASLDQRGIK